jgi:hypothetical protein
MRAAMFFGERGELDAFTREAFGLYWEEGGAPKGREETDEDGPVAEVARRVGADPGEVLECAAADQAGAQGRDRGGGRAGRVRGSGLFRPRRDVLWQR